MYKTNLLKEENKMVYFEQVYGVLTDEMLRNKFGSNVKYVGIQHFGVDGKYKTHYHYLIFSDVYSDCEFTYWNDENEIVSIPYFHKPKYSTKLCGLYMFHMSYNAGRYTHRSDKDKIEVSNSHLYSNIPDIFDCEDFDIDFFMSLVLELDETYGGDSAENMYNKISDMVLKNGKLSKSEIKYLVTNKDALGMYNNLIRLSSNSDVLVDL